MGIFIGNLKPGTTTSDLLDFMGDHDGITDIEIVKRRSEQGEVRFGHILFRSEDDAARAIELQKKKDLYGSMVLVREYIDRSDRERRSADLQLDIDEVSDYRRGVDRRYQ